MSSYTSSLSSSDLAIKLALFFAREKEEWIKMSGPDRINQIEKILIANTEVKVDTLVPKVSTETIDILQENLVSTESVKTAITAAKEFIIAEILRLSDVDSERVDLVKVDDNDGNALSILQNRQRSIRLSSHRDVIWIRKNIRNSPDMVTSTLFGSFPFDYNVRNIFKSCHVRIPDNIERNLDFIGDKYLLASPEGQEIADYIQNPDAGHWGISPHSCYDRMRVLIPYTGFDTLQRSSSRFTDCSPEPRVPTRQAPSPPTLSAEMMSPDRKTRYFKLDVSSVRPYISPEILPAGGGRFAGAKPLQAAKKAFATLSRALNRDRPECIIRFSMFETDDAALSRAAKGEIFTFRGTRTKLEKPIELSKNGATFTTIEYKHDVLSASPKNDRDAPEQPISSYMAYRIKRRPELLSASANSELTFGDLAKKTTTEWIAMTADEQRPFQALAEADNVRYQNECIAYYGPSWRTEKGNIPVFTPGSYYTLSDQSSDDSSGSP